MNASMLRFAVLVALLIPLTGCPLGNAMPGLWLFHLSSGSQTLGLELMFNGQTEDAPIGPHGVQANFLGSVTWSQEGNDVTVTQVNGPHVFYYTGKVTNGSAMSGTYLRAEGADPGENFGYWSAVRVAQ